MFIFGTDKKGKGNNWVRTFHYGGGLVILWGAWGDYGFFFFLECLCVLLCISTCILPFETIFPSDHSGIHSGVTTYLVKGRKSLQILLHSSMSHQLSKHVHVHVHVHVHCNIFI